MPPILLPLAGSVVGATIAGLNTKNPENRARNIVKGALGGVALGGVGGLATKGKAGIGEVLGRMYGGAGGKTALGFDVFQSGSSLFFGLQDGKLDALDLTLAATPFVGTGVGATMGRKQFGARGMEAARQAADDDLLTWAVVNKKKPDSSVRNAVLDSRVREFRANPDYWDWENNQMLGIGADMGLGMAASMLFR